MPSRGSYSLPSQHIEIGRSVIDVRISVPDLITNSTIKDRIVGDPRILIPLKVHIQKRPKEGYLFVTERFTLDDADFFKWVGFARQFDGHQQIRTLYTQLMQLVPFEQLAKKGRKSWHGDITIDLSNWPLLARQVLLKTRANMPKVPDAFQALTLSSLEIQILPGL